MAAPGTTVIHVNNASYAGSSEYDKVYDGGAGTAVDYPPMRPPNDAESDSGSPATTDWVGSSFSSVKIRHNFIKKVYLILLVQLVITSGFICLFLFCEPVKKWVQDNSWFYWTSYGVFVATYIILACIPSLRRLFPANFIVLLVFTLSLSYMTATISSYYDTEIVLITIGITACICLSISLFAIQTKIDFTMCSGLIFALFMLLFFCGITCAVFYGAGYYYYMNVLYGGIAALVFSLLLVFDTQRVIGGKNRHFVISPEEYITGAMELYVDIVYLFLIFLSCFANN
jgi:hypothetical protein